MQIALLHKHYEEDHLNQVKEQMKVLGAPVIRAIWSELYGMWLAVEGCHRLRAAFDLGYIPEIVNISNDDSVTIQIQLEDETFSVQDLLIDLNDSAPKTEILDFEEV